MFTYTFKTEVTIRTPFGITDFNSIKKEITQTATCITNKSTYPNGVVLEMVQYADHVEVTCSHEFIKNSDGSYSIAV